MVVPRDWCIHSGSIGSAVLCCRVKLGRSRSNSPQHYSFRQHRHLDHVLRIYNKLHRRRKLAHTVELTQSFIMSSLAGALDDFTPQNTQNLSTSQHSVEADVQMAAAHPQDNGEAQDDPDEEMTDLFGNDNDIEETKAERYLSRHSLRTGPHLFAKCCLSGCVGP